MKAFFRYWLPWTGAVILLIFFSTRSGDDLPLFDFPFSDKLLHLVYYFGLGLLSARLYYYFAGKRREDRPKAQLAAVLACLLFGLVDESIQSLSPGRFVEFGDLIADLLGGSLAALSFPAYRAFAARLEARLAAETDRR